MNIYPVYLLLIIWFSAKYMGFYFECWLASHLNSITTTPTFWYYPPRNSQYLALKRGMGKVGNNRLGVKILNFRGVLCLDFFWYAHRSFVPPPKIPHAQRLAYMILFGHSIWGRLLNLTNIEDVDATPARWNKPEKIQPSHITLPQKKRKKLPRFSGKPWVYKGVLPSPLISWSFWMVFKF